MLLVCDSPYTPQSNKGLGWLIAVCMGFGLIGNAPGVKAQTRSVSPSSTRPLIRMLPTSKPTETIPSSQAAPTPSRLVWHHGMGIAALRAAPIVRLDHDATRSDLAQMRDDQIIETPKGNHIRVSKYRAFQQAIAQGRAHALGPRPQGFALLPVMKGPAETIGPNEDLNSLLSRPPESLVRLPSGKSISVAQLRAMQPYVEKKYNIHADNHARPPLTGPVIKISNLAQLNSIPPNTPDSTVLESISGKKITLGELKASLKARFGGQARLPPHNSDR